MRKLNWAFFLTLLALNIKSQSFIIDTANIKWVTFYCGNASEITTVNDTLIVSPNPFDSIVEIEPTISDNDTILFSNDGVLEWVTYYCGWGADITTSNDTLVVSPNPFDSIAVIEFTISNNDSIWLEIYNITGNTIKSYYNGAILSSGSYTLNFNGDTLPNGIYFVKLKNTSTTIQTVKLIKSSNTVSVKENVSVENINIFPNPTSLVINIIDEQNRFQFTDIEIKNYLGQIVYSSSFNPQINVSDLSEGVYFLTLKQGHNSRTIKVIKQ